MIAGNAFLQAFTTKGGLESTGKYDMLTIRLVCFGLYEAYIYRRKDENYEFF